jgi:hypothetical protein
MSTVANSKNAIVTEGVGVVTGIRSDSLSKLISWREGLSALAQ